MAMLVITRWYYMCCDASHLQPVVDPAAMWPMLKISGAPEKTSRPKWVTNGYLIGEIHISAMKKNYLYLDLLDDLIGELDDHPIDLGHENSPATCGELFWPCVIYKVWDLRYVCY